MKKKENLVNFVKSRNDSLFTQRIGQFDIIFKERFDNNFDFRKVFNDINNLLPDHFLNLIDVVYIGQFDFLNDREVNASYLDGAIYLSNIQDGEKDLMDDIIHEISHAVEEKYGQEIYSDRSIEQNFILKRRRLERIIKYQGHNTEEYDFENISFDSKFDEFLYKDVGYEKLNTLSMGLYLAPYSLTSLREYFARGFEEYYLGNKVYLKNVCPYINSKITSLEENEEQNYETQY